MTWLQHLFRCCRPHSEHLEHIESCFADHDRHVVRLWVIRASRETVISTRTRRQLDCSSPNTPGHLAGAQTEAVSLTGIARMSSVSLRNGTLTNDALNQQQESHNGCMLQLP